MNLCDGPTMINKAIQQVIDVIYTFASREYRPYHQDGCVEQLQGKIRSDLALGFGDRGQTMIKEYDLASPRQFFDKLDAFRIIFIFDDFIGGE
jgi:hypothetical protein